MMPDFVRRNIGNILVGGIVVAMPVGVVLAVYLDEPRWLFVTLLAFIIVYAG